MTKFTPLKKRIHLFGVEIDPLTMGETVNLISQWLSQPEKTSNLLAM